MITMKRIGVLTSGGDSPGMNAAIRAVTRTALYHNVEVMGICRGYEGLIGGEFIPLLNYSVSNIIQRGGTILKSARSENFLTYEGMQAAYQQLIDNQIDALIAIGGDGTFRGAVEFNRYFSFPVIGLPGTIDNDLFGTDFTIGYDTAINTVVQAVDKIKDTASSHDRLFFVEVMGRDAGFIALSAGIATGAEDILIPEEKTSIEEVVLKLQEDWMKHKSSGIIIVAEGDDEGGAYEVAKKVEERFNRYKTRVTVLGHIQRGGSPSCNDRVLASTLGYEAVMALLEGKMGVMVGIVSGKLTFTPFEKAVKQHAEVNHRLVQMARVLSM
ncbi:MAG: 6-phosphofructokinase [Bacteroidales bacterium]